MCDVGDYRVPITQSYAWYRALKDHDVVTQFITFPVGGHSPGDPIRREDLQRRWIQWLGRYLPSPPERRRAPAAYAHAPATANTQH
jgi:dipeptidyl aminopeptidase/acylaminoacyl peptidase